MSGHHPDWNQGSETQLLANCIEGGIIELDVDEKIAGYDYSEESHQIHLQRPLSEEEQGALDALLMDAWHYECEFFEGSFDRAWIDCGALSEEARAYLLSLKA